MLADPELRSAEALDLPISTRKAYTGSLLLHPEIRHYPKKAFLQPAILIFDGAGELRYRWTHTEKITNLWGARGRPSPEAILELTRESLS